MKIGIAGYGFVGQAHHALLEKEHEIVISDPAKGYFGNLRTCDALIVCVATPSRHDGSCEMANVFNVIDNSIDIPILIKSTISVEGWRMLVDAFPTHRIAFSPEFLRAATAVEDLKTMSLLLVGGKATNFWKDVFNIKTEVCDPEALVLTKYARNTFLALKVSYFNQLFDLCKEIGVDFDAVRQYTTLDERIGPSHSEVTDNRGYGGHCFPKDVRAILHTAERDNVDLSILKEAQAYNIKIRKNNE